MIADLKFIVRTVRTGPTESEHKILQVRYWEDFDSPHRYMGEWQDVCTQCEES